MNHPPPTETETSSKVYLRFKTYGTCYLIDRKLPTVLENQINSYGQPQMTNDQWNQFCDKLDDNFLNGNFAKKVIRIVYVVIVFCDVIWILLMYSVESFDFTNKYCIIYLIFSLSIMGILSFMHWFTTNHIDKEALDRAREICQEETSTFSNAGIIITLKHLPPSIGEGIVLDSEQRQRYPNSYINVSVRVPEVYDIDASEAFIDTEHFNCDGGAADCNTRTVGAITDIENPQIATGTSLPLAPVPVVSDSLISSDEQHQPSSTVDAAAYPVALAPIHGVD
mmetsp:Transcript_6801/g.15419  ORF Transcript_6801/g.15419 Transcript_6801/m.15419 type:complete len:281 (-) Transcript_6801:472-1314(-)